MLVGRTEGCLRAQCGRGRLGVISAESGGMCRRIAIVGKVGCNDFIERGSGGMNERKGQASRLGVSALSCISQCGEQADC